MELSEIKIENVTKKNNGRNHHEETAWYAPYKTKDLIY